MNFVITFFLFVFLSAISFLLKITFDDTISKDIVNPLLVFSIIFAVISLITFCVAVFRTLDFREKQTKRINGIKSLAKKIEIVKENKKKYIDDLSENSLKIYPEYEKEIFKSISPADAEQLSVYLAKYPELKFNGVLEKYAKIINEFNDAERSYKNKLVDACAELKTEQDSNWYMFKKELPKEIADML